MTTNSQANEGLLLAERGNTIRFKQTGETMNEEAPLKLRSRRIFVLLNLFGLLMLVVSGSLTPKSMASPNVPDAFTMRVSTHADGTEGNNDSRTPAMTADGGFVAFTSSATNLTDVATNGNGHIFVKDMQSGVVSLASRSTAGVEGDNNSSDPAMAADGRYVAFESLAQNLVTNTVTLWNDVFVHDTEGLTTTLVSIASDGTPGNAISENPAISADGRHVAFQSMANLVGGDLSYLDVFVHDRDVDGDGVFDEPGEVATLRISQTAGGTPANAGSTDPAISADGRYIVFTSAADNLVLGDTNGTIDIFLYDRDADNDGIFDEPGEVDVVLISYGVDATPSNNFSLRPTISPDGSQVAFESWATNLVIGGTESRQHVYVRDRNVGMTYLVSQLSGGVEADDSSLYPALSEDGRFVAFESLAENLVAADTNTGRDIFVRDRDVDEDGVFDEVGEVATLRVSVDSSGNQMDAGQAQNSAISWDGDQVTFDSDASDLVLNDGNFDYDVFLHDREAIAPPPTGANLLVNMSGPDIVLDSTMVTYTVSVQNLGPELASEATMRTWRWIEGHVDVLFQGAYNPSQGECPFNEPCLFGDIASGDAATATVGLARSNASPRVYQGTVTVAVEASSSTSDPNPVNNTRSITTDFYNCSGANGCFLDEMVCFLFLFTPPLDSSLKGAEDFIPHLALYYHVRDEILTTPQGHYYTDLYYTHSDEATDLVFADANLWDLTLDGLFQWEANFSALVAGEGETAVITGSQIQAVEDFLDALSAAGSPELQQAIADERAKLPPFDTFIGMTMEEARGEFIGYSAYLPTITR